MDVGPYRVAAAHKEAPPVKFQAGSSHGLGVGEAHFVPVRVGAVAHQLEGAREAGVAAADLVAPPAGVGGGFLVSQDEVPGSADGSREGEHRGPVDGARFVELQGGPLRDGEGPAPHPSGLGARGQGDVVGELAFRDADGSRVGGGVLRCRGDGDVQAAAAQLDEGRVAQFLAVGGPGDVVAVGVDAHFRAVGRVNEAGDVLGGSRAVHEGAPAKDQRVGGNQARSVGVGDVEHQPASVEGDRTRAQPLGGVEVEGPIDDGGTSGEGVGAGVFNGQLARAALDQFCGARAVHNGSVSREEVGGSFRPLRVVDRDARRADIPADGDRGGGDAGQVFKAGRLRAVVGHGRAVLVQPDVPASRGHPGARRSAVPVEGFSQRLDAQVERVAREFQRVGVVAREARRVEVEAVGRQRAEVVRGDELVVVFHRLVHAADGQRERAARIEGERAARLDERSA